MIPTIEESAIPSKENNCPICMAAPPIPIIKIIEDIIKLRLILKST